MPVTKPNETMNITQVSILSSDTIEDAINKLGTLKKQDPNGRYRAIFDGIELNSWEFKDGKQALEHYNKQKKAQQDKAEPKQAVDNEKIDNRNNVRDFLADSMDEGTRTVITKEMIYSLETMGYNDGPKILTMQAQLLTNLAEAKLDPNQKQSIRDKITNLFAATLNVLYYKREAEAMRDQAERLENLDFILRNDLADEAAEKGGKS